MMEELRDYEMHNKSGQIRTKLILAVNERGKHAYVMNANFFPPFYPSIHPPLHHTHHTVFVL